MATTSIGTTDTVASIVSPPQTENKYLKEVRVILEKIQDIYDDAKKQHEALQGPYTQDHEKAALLMETHEQKIQYLKQIQYEKDIVGLLSLTDIQDVKRAQEKGLAKLLENITSIQNTLDTLASSKKEIQTKFQLINQTQLSSDSTIETDDKKELFEEIKNVKTLEIDLTQKIAHFESLKIRIQEIRTVLLQRITRYEVWVRSHETVLKKLEEAKKNPQTGESPSILSSISSVVGSTLSSIFSRPASSPAESVEDTIAKLVKQGVKFHAKTVSYPGADGKEVIIPRATLDEFRKKPDAATPPPPEAKSEKP